MFDHDLRLVHRRYSTTSTTADDISSEVDVSAISRDLTETWRELLSRLPSDVYAALKAALEDC